MFCLRTALSISLAGKPTMPEGAQMAQSDLRAGGIYFQKQNLLGGIFPKRKPSIPDEESKRTESDFLSMVCFCESLKTHWLMVATIKGCKKSTLSYVLFLGGALVWVAMCNRWGNVFWQWSVGQVCVMRQYEGRSWQNTFNDCLQQLAHTTPYRHVVAVVELVLKGWWWCSIDLLKLTT